jgi:hypothetical protein
MRIRLKEPLYVADLTLLENVRPGGGPEPRPIGAPPPVVQQVDNSRHHAAGEEMEVEVVQETESAVKFRNETHANGFIVDRSKYEVISE